MFITYLIYVNPVTSSIYIDKKSKGFKNIISGLKKNVAPN